MEDFAYQCPRTRMAVYLAADMPPTTEELLALFMAIHAWAADARLAVEAERTVDFGGGACIDGRVDAQMPGYCYRHPRTGLTLVLRGESPPTGQELEEILRQTAEWQSPGELARAIGTANVGRAQSEAVGG